jgi:hypothetical protein
VKNIKDMTQAELAAHIDTHLRSLGIAVILSGGAAVAVYSDHKYVSKDLDFIGRFMIDHKQIEEAMNQLGFEKKGKFHFHQDTPYYVEFLSGPASIGSEPIIEERELEFPTGTLRIISPTDAVKDRLASYYFWSDLQGLDQAVLIAQSNEVDMDNVGSWSTKQGYRPQFEEFSRLVRSGER